MAGKRRDRHTALKVDEGRLQVAEQALYYRRITAVDATPSGRAPSLVLLHEGLGCTAMWHDFPAALAGATQHSVVSYDRWGYGRSPKRSTPWQKNYLHVEAQDVLPQVLEELGINNAVLVGHSDGGSIALLAAAACPQKITAIVTEAAHVFVESITLQGIRQTVRLFGQRQLERRLAGYHGDKAFVVFRTWADTWLSPSFRDWNIEDCLGRVQCPALIIQGREDNYGTARQVESIVAGIGPKAQPMFIPECGHAPHRDAPEHVRDAIVEFVSALE